MTDVNLKRQLCFLRQVKLTINGRTLAFGNYFYNNQIETLHTQRNRQLWEMTTFLLQD